MSIALAGVQPLATRLADNALRSARILSRQHAGASVVPSYIVEVDGMRIPVTLDQIFDYVSPLHFETFENTSFKLEIDEKDMIQKALNSHFQQRNSRRVSSSSDESASEEDSDSLSPQVIERPAAVEGRSGRPRPTYSHLYRLQPIVNGAGPSRSVWHLKQQQQQQQGQQGPTTASPERALNDPAAVLSLKDQPKRQRTSYLQSLQPRTTSDSSASDDQSSPEVLDSPKDLDLAAGKHKSDSTSKLPVANIRLSSIQPGGSVVARAPHSGTASSAVSSSTLESSPSAEASAQLATETLRAQMQAARTAPVGPPRLSVAVAVSPRRDSDDDEDEGEEEDDDGEDEDEDEDVASFEVESILGHRLSDPRTHPPELGRVPVPLFHVKWAGYDDLTWEPEESFDDKALLDEYWRVVRASGREGPAGKADRGSKGKRVAL